MRTDPDVLAPTLIEWGSMARKMPPSFERHGVTYNLQAPGGGHLGKMLPGRGIMLAHSLKSLGITRQPPHVYDPDRYRHIEDEVGKHLRRKGIVPIQGAAISSYDGIIASRAGGKANDIAFVKTSITTVANVWSTLWHAGGQPGAGTYLATTAPTDRVPDRATPAGIGISAFLSNPAGTDKKYLLTFGYTATNQVNMAVIADVLNDGGAFRASVNTAETVASPTNATREYGAGTGIGNLMTLVVATAGTPGAGTLIVQYVNQAGSATNAPTLTVAAVAMTADTLLPAATTVVTAGGGTFFIPLLSPDTGVRAIKQTTFSVAGTGVLASNVFFPLSFVPGVAANAYIERDSTAQIDGLTELINVSQVIGHLALYILPNATTSGVLTGFLRTVGG